MNNEEKRKMFQIHLQQQNIEQLMEQYKNKSINFEEIMNAFNNLKKYIVGISYVLKTYDRQNYKQNIQKVYSTIIELKKNYEPKKKFKFSRRDGDFGVKTTIKEDLVEVKAEDQEIRHIPGLDHLSGQTLIVKDAKISAGSYKIIDCHDMQIDLLQKTEILFLKNLKKCIIRTALTKSTVFVDNCQDCKFALNCHQLRIHNTVNSEFSIFVTSKAIIQDCNGIIFQQYNFDYEGKKNDEQQFDRQGKKNLWKDIQDFNWLKESISSPHYSLREQ